MTAQTHSTSDEEKSLKLVEELVEELNCALDSLKNKEHGLFDRYRLWACEYLHRAADGFSFLRRSGQINASKFFVRPAIEMLFRLKAVNKQPDLFYQIGFSEHVQNKKFVCAAYRRLKNEAHTEEDQKKLAVQCKQDCEKLENKLKSFTDIFKAEFSEASPVTAELSVNGAAEKAGLPGLYDSVFRTYSRYSHGAFEVSFGDLDKVTTPQDNWIMALCTCEALLALVSLGAKSPNHLDSLCERVLSHVQE